MGCSVPALENWKELVYSCPRINDHTLDEKISSLFPHAEYKSDRFGLSATKNAGTLEILPLELLSAILCHLDLLSLSQFRRANRRTIELVRSLPLYEAIMTHAPNALRGILALGTGPWITWGTLREKITTPDCEHCGDFGGYLYLLTCRRVCFLCFTQEQPYLPLLPSHATRMFGLDKQTVQSLPCVRVIPGIYSPNERKIPRSVSVLVDRESARLAGIRLHGSLDAMERYVASLEAREIDAYNQRIVAAEGDRRPALRMRRPGVRPQFDGRSGNPFRFVAIIRVPWIRRGSREAEWGFHCLGCQNLSRFPLHWRRQFTSASFKEHLRECGKVTNGKHCVA
ncbi:hypothetical protein VTG60DRAFT_1196 [Thermothelomyces hinnuleus]